MPPLALTTPAARRVDGVIIDVLAPGEGDLPRRGRRSHRSPAERLADVLAALAGARAAPVVELNFRKSLEALAAASVAAQAADLECYARFLESQPGLPADEAQVVAYIEHLERLGRKPATVGRRLASLAAAHAYLGLPSPTRATVVVHTLRALRRRVGVAQRQALGLRFGEGVGRAPAKGLTLSAMLEASGGDAAGLRDAALLSLGYDAGLRVSELVAVEMAQLEPHEDGSAVLHIPRTKTDQEGQGAHAWVSPDTMRRVRAWVAVSGIREGPLFRRVGVTRTKAVAARRARSIAELAPNAAVDRVKMQAVRAQPASIRYAIGDDALTRQGVNLIYRRVALRAADLGLVALTGTKLRDAIAALSTHSLRVGLTQDLFAAGEDVGPVAQALRWTSTATAIRYARNLAPRSN